MGSPVLLISCLVLGVTGKLEAFALRKKFHSFKERFKENKWMTWFDLRNKLDRLKGRKTYPAMDTDKKVSGGINR